MSAPESETFRDLRARHKAQRKALHEMNRLLRATHQREAVMRGKFEQLPDPACGHTRRSSADAATSR